MLFFFNMLFYIELTLNKTKAPGKENFWHPYTFRPKFSVPDAWGGNLCLGLKVYNCPKYCTYAIYYYYFFRMKNNVTAVTVT